MPEIIFKDNSRNLLIQRSNTYAPTFLALLERTVWGSGGLKYTISGMAEILNRLSHPHFLTIEENDKLIGVLTLMQKTTRIKGKDYPAFYSYALAVEGKGHGTLLSEQALHYGLNKLGEQGIYYGYVEADNIHSLKTVQKVGRKSLGQYHSLIVSRVCPKDSDCVEKLEYSKRGQLVQLLYKQYENHSLIDFEQAVKAEEYYILRHGGEIIAGLQCERKHLAIKHLPGASGFFLLKALPQIPFLPRIIHEGGERFAFEGIF